MSNLLKRLAIIQSTIELGDADVIALQAQRLPQEAVALSQLLTQQKYTQAVAWIEEYRQNNTMPTEFIDPEVSALRLELSSLEDTLTTLTATKAEYERRITEFNAAYMREVGPIMEQILQQRIQNAEKYAAEQQDEEGVQQARDKYEEFHRQQQAQPQVEPLSDDGKAELKKLYKQAAQKCHPDRLPDEQKDKGTEKFKELQEAYNQQDLQRVQQLLEEIEGGDWTRGSATITDKTVLRRRIAKMHSAITELQAAIDALLKDETWCLIESLATARNSWDDYFSKLRAELEQQLVQD